MTLPPLPPIKECPHCGCAMIIDDKRNTGFSHPRDAGCILNGHFFGAARAALWNRRRVSVRYDIVDGLPVFSRTGLKPATATMLNDLVAYYESVRQK